MTGMPRVGSGYSMIPCANRKVIRIVLAVGMLAVMTLCAACAAQPSAARNGTASRLGLPETEGRRETSTGAADLPVEVPVPASPVIALVDGSEPGRQQAVLSPDGTALVTTGPRTEGDREVVTLYLIVDGAPPRDLLPGDRAVHGVSTAKFLTGWVDQDTFAYEEHVGTGARELFLLDTRTWEPIATERLAATYFMWSPNSNYVAGQWVGGRPVFWVWDRAANEMLELPSLPGDYQSAEFWSFDGRHLLFSSWTGAWPADARTQVEYYSLDVAVGTVRSFDVNLDGT